MQDCSPGPAASRYASSALKDSTSRKSSFSAPGTWAGIQVLPVSVVRRYVPWVPLAHTTLAETALTPRRFSVVWLSSEVTVWAIARVVYRVRRRPSRGMGDCRMCADEDPKRRDAEVSR